MMRYKCEICGQREPEKDAWGALIGEISWFLCPECAKALEQHDWEDLYDREMWGGHEPVEGTCPWCDVTIKVPAGCDPLKTHLDQCKKRPVET